MKSKSNKLYSNKIHCDLKVYIGFPRIDVNYYVNEHLAAKANAMLGKTWSLCGRKFRDDWRKRVKLFDALVKSVISYGAEIWGWREWKELEKIQNKYIK